MKIGSETTGGVALLDMRLPPGRGAPLRAGQRLSATLLDQEGNRVRLRLDDGAVLAARGRVDAPPGSRLHFRVERREGDWLLRLEKALDRTPLARLLRESLPKALEMAALARLFPPGQARSTILQRLWDALPLLGQLFDSPQLREAFLRAGLQREGRLARGRVDGGDLKTLLLSAWMETGERDEREVLEGLLNQLRSRQAQLLQDPGEGHLTLPFRDGERFGTVEFQWRHRTRGKGQSTLRLRVILSPPRLGPIQADLGWDGVRLEVTLWAEREETVEWLSAERNDLVENLRRHGLPCGEIPCRRGPPPPFAQPGPSPRLLDLRA